VGKEIMTTRHGSQPSDNPHLLIQTDGKVFLCPHRL